MIYKDEAMTNSDGWGIERLKRDLDALQEQVREVKDNLDNTNQTVTDQLRDLNAFVFQNVPPIINYINNGDFVFEQEDYVPGTAYAGDDNDCAHWYWRPNNSSSQYTEHTTSVQSGDSVTNSLFADDAWWSKTSGEVVFGTRAALAQPLPKNLAFPAGTLYCRLQVKLKDNTKVLDPAWRLRAAIWDNTAGQQKIIEGAVFDVTVNAAVPSPGAFTRKYILRVDTNMDFFYSDVLTPSQVTNQVTVDVIDNVNFVTVSWQVFSEAVAYKLYRHDSQSNEWREIAVIRNGATSFRDVGGRVGLPLFTPPGANILPRAQALFVNFGQYCGLEYKDVIFNIFVPTAYAYSVTTNKQWLRIDMVDENLNSVVMPDDALLIDKVALGYTNGRFCYSAQDLAANAAVTATTPPPVPPPGGEEGGGGGTPPEPGGGGSGGRGCVTPDTKILAIVSPGTAEWKMAKDVKEGDYLVNLDGEGSKVSRVIKGITNRLYVITTDKNRQLHCSPSHRLMECAGDEEGKLVCEIKVGDWLWILDEKARKAAEEVVAIEILDMGGMTDVLTFQLEGHRTYVSNGIVSHNLKPILEA
jgi:hypothetical protein